MNFKPTEAELEILQVLWTLGPSTVRAANIELSRRRAELVGYTTTLKFLQIMLDKGLVVRDASSRSHVYSAAISEAESKGKLLDRFLENTFRGSASDLVLQALGNHRPSDEELSRIKALIEAMEKSDHPKKS